MPGSATGPAVQAGYMKNLLAELRARGHGGLLPTRASALVDEIEAASRAAWLPIESNVGAVEAICAELGEERGLELLTECLYAQFETPLWKGFIGPAVRLVGRDPVSFGRWIPRAIQLVFRECGDWAVERTDDAELTIRVTRLPSRLSSQRLWLRSMGVGMRPVLILCGVTGDSDLVDVDSDAGCASIRLHWEAAGRAH